MLEKNLRIIILTWNRSKHLETTLSQLHDSPFQNCSITVLNNNSKDDTFSVCEKYKNIFSDFKAIHHTKNRGFCGNLFKAYEIADSPYTWILADDDTFDFSGCDDIIEAISNNDVDLISVGAPGQQDWERGLATTTKQLFKKGSRFFFINTFVPSLIFKTKVLDEKCIQACYAYEHYLYPHFPFVNHCLEQDFSIYTSKNILIQRGIEVIPTFSHEEWIYSWLKSCQIIKNPDDRKTAIYEIAPIGTFSDCLYDGLKVKEAKSDGEFLKYILSLLFCLSKDQMPHLFQAWFKLFVLEKFIKGKIGKVVPANRDKAGLTKWLKKKNFQKNIDKLAKKYKDKKILVYGAGLLSSAIFENYDLLKFNIVAVADNSFKESGQEFFEKDAINPTEIINYEYDVILIATLNEQPIINYLTETLKIDNTIVEMIPIIPKSFI